MLTSFWFTILPEQPLVPWALSHLQELLPGYIFDIKLDKLNNQLYVCGTNFVSKVQAVKSLLPVSYLRNHVHPFPGDPNTGNTSLNYVLCGGGSSVMLTPFNYQNLSNPVLLCYSRPAFSNTNGFVCGIALSYHRVHNVRYWY